MERCNNSKLLQLCVFLLLQMTMPQSLNRCLKRVFTSFNEVSRKNKLISNLCSLKKSNKLTANDFVTNYKLVQTRNVINTKITEVPSGDGEEEDDCEDKLQLNHDDDNDEEYEDSTDATNKQNIFADNKNDDKQTETTGLNKITETVSNVNKKNKKFKYDSDVIIIYDDICDLPSDMSSIPLTEEEIEHVNSGGAEYNYGDYSCQISFVNKKNNKKGGNNKK